ncbi:Diol/glycerol dehydratase, large subunit [Sesbania bispinosa]|nr:Diol/glycerol dehydratase, large subunit [Sesbania bispinosa]
MVSKSNDKPRKKLFHAPTLEKKQDDDQEVHDISYAVVVMSATEVSPLDNKEVEPIQKIVEKVGLNNSSSRDQEAREVEEGNRESREQNMEEVDRSLTSLDVNNIIQRNGRDGLGGELQMLL